MIKALVNSIKNYRILLYRKKCTQLVVKQAKSTGKNLKINYKSHVTKNTIIGNNAGINGLIVSGGGNVRIGDNFHCGSECLIMTQNHNYDKGKSIPYDDTYILKDVDIEDNVWFGSRVIILPGVSIGEGAIIQAGAVVVNDIPKYAIAGGNPAKVFKERNIDHYENLKKEKKFY